MMQQTRTALKKFKADLVDKLTEYNKYIEDVEADRIQIEQESKNHSKYRKFCLDNFLGLSEHSLYCFCNGAKKDDLTTAPFEEYQSVEFVPQMEAVLNRLKSEFSLARFLYYQSFDITLLNDYIDKETSFHGLLSNEVLGIHSEMLRTSFRLCLGIFDKIALGICELYDLPVDKDEHIYFQNFWKPKGNDEDPRWKAIKKIEKKSSLIALYSVACDLNDKTGEWKELKEYRDCIEHKILSLSRHGLNKDRYDNLFKNVNFEDFQLKTKELLQLCRASIFYFTFCVRFEAKKSLSE